MPMRSWSSMAPASPPERHHADLQQRIRAIEQSKAMIEHALDCDEHDFAQCPSFKRLVENLV